MKASLNTQEAEKRMEMKKRNALRRLGYTLAGLAGAVALLAGVGLSGAGLIRAQRGERAERLLTERYGEPFTVDRVYGRSAGIGYDLWPFILMEERYTVAAHSNAYPEMIVRADVNTREDRILDNYAAQRISRNTEAYLTREILEPALPDGKWFFNVGISEAVGYGRPLDSAAGNSQGKDPGDSAAGNSQGKDPGDSAAGTGGRYASMTGLALHELEAEAVCPTATLFYSPASGHADAEIMYDTADRILEYFEDCTPEDPGAVTVYLITKPSCVEQVRAYLTGNRIGNYSTLQFFAAMEPAVSAVLKYSPKEKTRTPREEFVFEPLYPGMPGETVITD